MTGMDDGSKHQLVFEVENQLRQMNHISRFYHNPHVLACYELARDYGALIFINGGMAVEIKRFHNFPRYRIFQVNLGVSELISYGTKIAPTSYKPIQIHNLGRLQIDALKDLDPQGIDLSEEEIIISTKGVGENPAYFLSKREMEMLHRDQKEMDFRMVQGRDDQVTVIKEWKKVNEPKHFRLSITRDYTAANWYPGGVFHFVGYRQSKPVCLQIFAIQPAHRGMVVQLVDKALNYTTMPGGRPGTSNASLVFSCRCLSSLGIEWINLGSSGGGNPGLGERKNRFKDYSIMGGAFQLSASHRQKENT